LKRIARHTQTILQLQPKPNGQDGATYRVQTEIRDNVLCLERLCDSLSSILLYPSTHERLLAIGGLQELVRLCKISNDSSVLVALSKTLIPMIPPPAQILIYHRDSTQHPVEKCQVVQVLKKVKLQGFKDVANPPDWLESAITVLSITDQGIIELPQSILRRTAMKNTILRNLYLHQPYQGHPMIS
jgi:Leucine-rich repeat (LRR) protein